MAKGPGLGEPDGHGHKQQGPDAKSPADFQTLTHSILHCSGLPLRQIDFLQRVAYLLLDFSASDEVSIHLEGRDQHYCSTATRRPRRAFRFKGIGSEEYELERQASGLDDAFPVDRDHGGSVFALPLEAAAGRIGFVRFRSSQEVFFPQSLAEAYEKIAEVLANGLANQRTQAELRERVKELTCLYGVAQLAEEEGVSLQRVLQGVADLLPAAWQYPEIAAARIRFDGMSCATSGFRSTRQTQKASIVIKGERRGAVELAYLRRRPAIDEGPFLAEERSLIDEVARQVAFIVERRQAEEEQIALQEQLQQADRLATIGQLAAGVAHELNEPLGGILGFAQLAAKCPGVPEDAFRDLKKIEAASLHAREVIKKLLVFSRQVPAEVASLSLNELVAEALYFLEARCRKSGIVLVCDLDDSIPEIQGDPAQLRQVLVNLAVNSIQAMSDGGTLTIRTADGKDDVILSVRDDGHGMSPDVLEKIFLPFFTTKDINEGTGLGLAVVHGIVTAHNGTIAVKSEPGAGATFVVRLPVRSTAEEEEV